LVGPVEIPSGTFAWFADPDGNTIGLFRRTSWPKRIEEKGKVSAGLEHQVETESGLALTSNLSGGWRGLPGGRARAQAAGMRDRREG